MAVLEKGKSLETSNDVPDKRANKKKDKKRKAAEINGGEGDSSILKQENVDGDDQLEIYRKKKKKVQEGDGSSVEKKDGKKKKKQKKNRESGDNSNNDATVQDSAVSADTVLGVEGFTEAGCAENVSDKVHSNGVEVNTKRKKKRQEKNENVVEEQDRKKQKKKKKNNENDDNTNNHSTLQDASASAKTVPDAKERSEAKLGENGPDDLRSNEGAKVNAKKKKKSQEGENGAEAQDRKKKKNKKENDDKRNHSSSMQDVVVNSEGGEASKKKKKKSKASENINLTPNKSNKKVRFSDQNEVFPVPGKSGGEEVENLVIGKRFTPEEDSIVKKAVYDYIEEHSLGEEGLQMVLNSRKHAKKLKGCWREIAKAIPYRPYLAVYGRAQVLFRRSESRSWTQEEYDMVLKHQELHGNDWKTLADELGKHHWHVKDTYRRIKLPNRRKGHWSQEEYQNLFNLVNTDLLLKISEEKKSKHGMLRDNICWSAISDRLETRAFAPCCLKWYGQMTSPMVVEGIWSDADDYRLIGALYSLDENCMEDVDWDSLVEGRSGEVCRKRWRQMRKHIGHHGKETFAGQVEVLAQRYCPHLVEAREAWDSKPFVDVKPAVQQ